MSYKISIQIKTWAMVEVFKLEGIKVPLVYGLDGVWKTNLSDFETKGDLDVFLYCTGVNGANWSMELKVNNKKYKDPIEGEIDKGYSSFSAALKMSDFVGEKK